LLTEHEWWGKNRMPYYEEISHIPLMIHHPGQGEGASRCTALAQTIDLMPTFLGVFGAAIPAEVQGHSLQPHLVPGSAPSPPRDALAFGMFGGPLGVTDGRHAYYLYPDDLRAPGLGEYTLMPMHMDALVTGAEIETARMAAPFDFTKGMPLMRIDALADAKRIPAQDGQDFGDVGTALYDLVADPGQRQPLRDAAIEGRLCACTEAVLRAHDAPEELYGRYGLTKQT
jgi:hypothetical protein